MGSDAVEQLRPSPEQNESSSSERTAPYASADPEQSGPNAISPNSGLTLTLNADSLVICGTYDLSIPRKFWAMVDWTIILSLTLCLPQQKQSRKIDRVVVAAVSTSAAAVFLVRVSITYSNLQFIGSFSNHLSNYRRLAAGLVYSTIQYFVGRS